jgi:hypothetical protein
MKRIFLLLFTAFALLANQLTFAQNPNKNPNSLVLVSQKISGGFHKIIFTFSQPVNPNFVATSVTTATSTYTTNDGVTHVVSGCNFKKISFKNVEWMYTPPNTFVANNKMKEVVMLSQHEGVFDYEIGFCNIQFIKKTILNTAKTRQIILWFK